MSRKGYLDNPVDTVYLYDGSIEGWYCCVYEAVYAHEVPAAIYPVLEAQPTLFRQKNIETDLHRAARVHASIPVKFSHLALEMLQTVFLSCLQNKELAMLRFLLMGYAHGPKALDMLAHPDIGPVHKAHQYLLGERHAYLGFLRFSDYDGVLAASFAPKNFLLPFLAGHFIDRFSQEDFMIYDKTHKAALFYQNGQHRILPVEDMQFPDASEEEEGYRNLWKQFYKTIAIKARHNPKCRQTHMPKRFWAEMTEMRELL